MFSTLRVYALSRRDWRFATLVCLLMTGPIIGNVVRSSALGTVHAVSICCILTRCIRISVLVVTPQYNLPTQKPDNMPPPYNCEVDNTLMVAQHTMYACTSPALPHHTHTANACPSLRADVRLPVLYIWPFRASVELRCAAVVLLSQCTLIVGDATVLGVTWWKTWSIKKAADTAHISTSLVDLLLRDGMLGTVIHPDVHTDPKRYS